MELTSHAYFHLPPTLMLISFAFTVIDMLCIISILVI